MQEDYLTADQVKETSYNTNTTPRTNSRTGYGGKIPTPYKLRLSDNRHRRVYAMCYGNGETLYVLAQGKIRFLDPEVAGMLDVARSNH